MDGLLAVGVEQDPIALGPLLGEGVWTMDGLAGQTQLVAAVHVRAIDLEYPGTVELSREHLAAAAPRRRLTEGVAVLLNRERCAEVGTYQGRFRRRGLATERDQRNAEGQATHCGGPPAEQRPLRSSSHDCVPPRSG